jgi:hypothetical protein
MFVIKISHEMMAAGNMYRKEAVKVVQTELEIGIENDDGQKERIFTKWLKTLTEI